MKVLIINSYYHPVHRSHHEGGIETISLQMFDQLSTCYETYLACTSDSTIEGENIYKIPNCSKDRFDGNRYSQKQGFDELAEFVIANDIHKVITNSPSPSQLETLYKYFNDKNYEVDLYQVYHGVPQGMPGKAFIDLVKRLKDEPKSCKVYGISVSEYIHKIVDGASDFILPSTFFETDVVAEDPEPYVVHFGRIVQYRNIKAIYEGAKAAGYKLHLIGDTVNYPTELEYFENTVKPLIDSGEVVHHGYLSQQDALQIIKKATAVVNLTAFEAFNLALFEAQKIGVPVVWNYKNIKNGIDSYATEETSYGFNSYRKRGGFLADQVAEGIKYCSGLNHNSIRALMSLFSPDTYLTNLKEILNKG